MSDQFAVGVDATPPSDDRWLNRNVLGIGLTSLLADVSHEMATAILPGFLTVLGVSPAILGAIEGIADSVASFVKLAAGWFSDRVGRRKPLATAAYFLTGLSTGLFALAQHWPLVLAARTAGWLGRGVRSPLKNAILADSITPNTRGRAFGFERAGDTIGAVIGPLIAVGLLACLHPRLSGSPAPFRVIFLLALVPGLGAGGAFGVLVHERRRPPLPTRLWASIWNLPADFRRLLFAATIFGMGDFARTLMILAATQLLAPSHGLSEAAETGAVLYVVHNVVYAAASYPIGALSDRLGRRGLLVLGYLAGALSALALGAAFHWKVNTGGQLLPAFVMAGVSIAMVDALEGAMTADLVAPRLRGTAYGVLGTANGVGDLVASVVVGGLWTAASPIWAFAFAAVMMALGSLVLFRLRWRPGSDTESG